MFQKEKTLEEKIYLTWFEDGLIDIFIGIAMLLVGLQMMLQSPYFMIIGMPIAFIWLKITKKKVTEARLGKVKFTEAREQSIAHMRRVFTTVLITILVMGVALFMLRSQAVGVDGSVGWTRGLPIGVILIVVLGLFARMVPLPRFGVYALMFAALMAADIIFGYPLYYAFIVGGGITAFMGTGDYSRFKDKYPLAEEQGDE